MSRIARHTAEPDDWEQRGTVSDKETRGKLAAHAVLFGFAKEYYLPLRALLDVFGMGRKNHWCVQGE